MDNKLEPQFKHIQHNLNGKNMKDNQGIELNNKKKIKKPRFSLR